MSESQEMDFFSNPNLNRHLSGRLMDYLVDITKSTTGNMTKLAVLSILFEMFHQNMRDRSIKICCLHSGLVDSLLMGMDVGLEKKLERADLIFVEVVMEIMWHLSQLTIGHLQPLIAEPVIRRLLNYADITSNFYVYSEETVLQMKELCENKHLVAMVDFVPMTTELVKSVYSKLPNLGKVKKLPSMLLLCKLCDTSNQDYDIDIAEHFVSNGMAWPELNSDECELEDADNESPDDSPLPKKQWEDLMVTQVINDTSFWAHVGLPAIQRVKEIQRSLKMSAAGLEYCFPKKDDMVVVKGIVSGVTCYLRAQVLQEESGILEVIAIDYGFLLGIPSDQSFALPSDVSIENYPPQASLCQLAGARPPARNVGTVKYAIATLVNLSKLSFPAGDIVADLGGVAILTKLLQSCPNKPLTSLVAKLLTNLSCNAHLNMVLSSEQLIAAIIEKCKNHMWEKTEPDSKVVIKTCFSSLCNLLHSNDNRRYFYQKGGMDTVLRILVGVKQTSSLYKLGVKLLGVFVGKADFPTSIIRPSVAPKAVSPLKDGTLTRDMLMKKREKTDDDVENERSGHQRMLPPKPVEKALNEERLREMEISDSSDSEGEHGDVAEDNQSDNDMILPNRHHSSVDNSDRPVVALDTADIKNASSIGGRYYIKGTEVDFVDDLTHEFRPNRTISKVSATVTSRHACALLNSGKGGTMYFGIGKEDRLVYGVVLSREDRDEFRLGVDQMMANKIMPMLLHYQFDICYIPVVEQVSQRDPKAVLPIPDAVVVEIMIKSSKSTVYTTNEGKCYYRFGPSTTHLCTQELRQLILLDEQAEYIDEIKRLRMKLSSLQTPASSSNIKHPKPHRLI